MTMADKIVVMHDGRIEQMGAPLDLYDNPANVFVAGFIGSPAMNFVKGRIANKDGAQQFVSDGDSITPVRAMNVEDGQPAIYRIRPEHIAIGDGGLPVGVSVLESTGV
jgi:multiple sugar transport system ATP-binding protein